MTKDPVCGNTPALSRRSFLAAAPAVDLDALRAELWTAQAA